MAWQQRVSSLLVFISASVAMPSHVVYLDERGRSLNTILVQADVRSPGFAALEDVRDVPDHFARESIFSQHDFVGPVTRLRAGVKFELTSDPIDFTQSIRLSRIAIRSRPYPDQNDGFDFSKTDIARKDNSLLDGRGELRPLAQRKELLLDRYAHVDLRGESISERAQALISEALSGSPLYLSAQHAESGEGPLPAPEDRIERRTAPSVRSPSSLTKVDTFSPLQYHIEGQIEVTGGLAFLGPTNRIRIYRRVESEVLESGRVNEAEGTFEINIREPTGILEAELIDENNAVMGRGELDLDPLPKSSLYLKLKPIAKAGVISVASAYSFGNHKVEVPSARVTIDGFDEPLPQNDDGEFIEPEMHGHSVFVARASARRHWGTLSVVLARNPVHLELFPDKSVDALLNLTLERPRSSKEKMGVVWGKVVDGDGKPLAGVKVELAGGLTPVYFNHPIPDKNLQSTTANGDFAFVGVTAGVHSIRALYRGEYVPAQVIPVEAGHVSYVQVQIGKGVVVPVQVHDAFDRMSKVPSLLHISGRESNIELAAGEGHLRYLNGLGSMVMEVDAGDDYLPARFLTSRQARQFRFPVLQKAWIEKLNSAPHPKGSARVVGLVGESFSVEVRRNGQLLDGVQVIYFDSKGQAIQGDIGPEKGGFLATGIAPGAVDLAIHLHKQDRILYQTRYVDPEFLEVIPIGGEGR